MLLLLLPLLVSCATPPPDVAVFENLTQHLGQDPETKHLILKPSPTCMQMLGEFECGHGVYIMSQRQVFVGEAFEFTYIDKKDVPKTLPPGQSVIEFADGRTGLRKPLTGKPWSQLKKESIYVPAQESYAPLSTWIINSCKKMKCDDQVNRFKVKVDSLDSIGAVIKRGAK
jgi:hypothetical protein